MWCKEAASTIARFCKKRAGRVATGLTHPRRQPGPARARSRSAFQKARFGVTLVFPGDPGSGWVAGASLDAFHLLRKGPLHVDYLTWTARCPSDLDITPWMPALQYPLYYYFIPTFCSHWFKDFRLLRGHRSHYSNRAQNRGLTNFRFASPKHTKFLQNP